jgi:hypothetical protein
MIEIVAVTVGDLPEAVLAAEAVKSGSLRGRHWRRRIPDWWLASASIGRIVGWLGCCWDCQSLGG